MASLRRCLAFVKTGVGLADHKARVIDDAPLRLYVLVMTRAAAMSLLKALSPACVLRKTKRV